MNCSHAAQRSAARARAPVMQAAGVAPKEDMETSQMSAASCPTQSTAKRRLVQSLPVAAATGHTARISFTVPAASSAGGAAAAAAPDLRGGIAKGLRLAGDARGRVRGARRPANAARRARQLYQQPAQGWGERRARPVTRGSALNTGALRAHSEEGEMRRAQRGARAAEARAQAVQALRRRAQCDCSAECVRRGAMRRGRNLGGNAPAARERRAAAGAARARCSRLLCSSRQADTGCGASR